MNFYCRRRKLTKFFLILFFTVVILLVKYKQQNISFWLGVQRDGINWRDKMPYIIKYNQHLDEGVQEISSILDNMKVQYPSFIWFYTGWIQDLDVAYDANGWNTSPLVVHVIPFSHNDPGWHLSYEDYFKLHSREILNLALQKLSTQTNLTFVWSEVCFLKMWFESISNDDKDAFKRLVNEGRFEILTGGMVMPDEAIVSYYAFLNVLSEGHIWLKDELNYSASTAWSLDSFGHSSTYAYFLKLSGIDRTFIQRTHYALKKHLALKKEVEFHWVQKWDNDKNAKGLFTHMSPFLLYSLLYSCGPNVQICCQFEFVKRRCWEKGNYEAADAITIENIHEKSVALLEMLRKKAQFVNHNNVLLLVGDDFSFDSVQYWDIQWNNMQKIFEYLSGNPDFKVRIEYSTIGRYLKTAEKEMSENHVAVPNLEGDFFPYSDRSNQYWSGYYSTRPKLKSLIRSGQSLLRSAEILFGLVLSLKFSSKAFINKDLLFECNKKLSELRNEFAIYQHHDTITGTSRLNVIEETQQKLIKFHNSLESFFDASMILFSQRNNKTVLDLDTLHLFRRNSRLFSSTEDVVFEIPWRLFIFNSLPAKRKETIRFYVNTDDIAVYEGKIQPLFCQTNPAFDKNFEATLNLFEVHVEVEMKPLSMLQIDILHETSHRKCIPASIKTKNESFHMQNGFFDVHFEEGIMKKVTEIQKQMHYDIQIKFMAYSSTRSLNPFSDKSGAYIFLPNEKPVEVSPLKGRMLIVEGVLVSFVIVEISHEVIQVVEVFHHQPLQQSIHITNVVDISRKCNYEISMVLKTSLNNDYFFTDLNGYQMMKRKWRRKFDIQGNFYPMTNMAFIENDTSRVTLVTGQCHAVTGRYKGEMEVMLDRRLLQDDWRGLGEDVTDNVPITTSFAVLFETLVNRNSKIPKPSKLAIDIVSRLDDSLLALHQDGNFVAPKVFNSKIDLPCGVHLVLWRVLPSNQSVYKFTITLHYYGLESSIFTHEHFDPFCFSDVVIIPSKFCGELKIYEVYEMNLTGTQIKQRLYSYVLKLKKMEIKTWLFILFR